MRFLPLALALALTALPALAQTGGATGWTLISVEGRAAEKGGRIAFSADGAIFGTTGCNRFKGTAAVAYDPVSDLMTMIPESGAAVLVFSRTPE